jgi:hypothetical protein
VKIENIFVVLRNKYKSLKNSGSISCENKRKENSLLFA